MNETYNREETNNQFNLYYKKIILALSMDLTRQKHKIASKNVLREIKEIQFNVGINFERH